MEVYGMTEGLT